jgi:WD40 repeat protein
MTPMSRRTAAWLLGAAMFAVPAMASFITGSVFVGAGNGQVFVYDPNGNLLQKLSSGLNSETTGMAFDSSGNLYSTNFGAQQIIKYDINGNKIGTFGSGFNADPESIVFDKSGNAYVGQADGTHSILKFGPTGTLLKTLTPTSTDRGTDWIDLSADQTTIYFAGEGATIRTINTSTGVLGPNFTTKGSQQFALRLLSDGGILVANGSNVLRYDSSGNIIKTYGGFTGTSELFALNLDPDGTSFWTGDIGGSTKVFRVDIATGTILKTWAASKDGASEVAGLAVFGEITQGGPPPVTGAPEPSSIILAAGGLLLIIWRTRAVKLGQ